MDKSTFYTKGLHRRPSCCPHIIRNMFFNIEHTVIMVVDTIHDRNRGMIACLKYRFSLTVHDRIIRVNLSGHKLFHNKLHTMKIFFMECPQLILTLQFISRGRTDTIIRLHDNRISHLLHKSKTFRQIRHQMIPGCWNTCLCIIRFHFRFILHMFHVSRLHSRNIKIRSQSGILLQPIFIIAFKTIH